MSLLHLNISSSPLHIDEFMNLLSELNSNLKIIGITETRLITKKDPVNIIKILNYNTEHTPTESDKGGALLYISKEINYKTRNDLKVYKEKLLESKFIEVLSRSNKNTIVGLYISIQALQLKTSTLTFYSLLLIN